SGRLARASLAGGAPRERLDRVSDADFAPDGELAVARVLDGRWQLEWPVGHVVFQTDGWIGEPRVSPGRTRPAFPDHPLPRHPPPPDAAAAASAVLTRAAPGRVRADAFVSERGLAWSPSGREVWLTATRKGSSRALLAVDLDGRERLLYAAPGMLRLLDVAADGRALVAREDARERMTALLGDEERDLSWLDGTPVPGPSADGQPLVFTQSWDRA